MDKGLGFIRNLKLAWLDKAVETRLHSDTQQSMRQELDDALRDEIVGIESRRKTIDVLVGIWCRSAEKSPPLFHEALDFVPELPIKERIWLHYGLTLLSYPFFRLTTTVLGQLARTGEPITRQAVKERLAREIGHLGALNRAAERIVASLVDWGVLVYQQKGNTYAPQLQTFRTNNMEVESWLLRCALSAHPSSQIPFQDLIRLPELFPMHFSIGLDALRNSPKFQIHREGLWDIVNLPVDHKQP